MYVYVEGKSIFFSNRSPYQVILTVKLDETETRFCDFNYDNT